MKGGLCMTQNVIKETNRLIRYGKYRTGRNASARCSRRSLLTPRLEMSIAHEEIRRRLFASIFVKMFPHDHLQHGLIADPSLGCLDTELLNKLHIKQN